MMKLIEILFNPPQMPRVNLPILPHRIEATVRSGLAELYRMVYYRGVWDGLIAGILLTLFFVPKVHSRILEEPKDA